jgi:hypothetical protein
MNKTFWTVAALSVAAAAAIPVAAKTDPKKEKPTMRWAHSYAEAVEEAKDRNCVIFVTIHAEH